MSIHYLKAHDVTKFNVNVLCYGLQTSFKGPHNFMVTTLGLSVKWPSYSVLWCMGLSRLCFWSHHGD